MDAYERVKIHMKVYYDVDIDTLEISDVHGYWEDKEPKINKGHPLHGCLGCSGPFKATYVYHDHYRDDLGRFASPYRSWAEIKNSK